MAKQRRTHTMANGLQSLLKAIEKVADAELGNLSPDDEAEAKRIGLEAVKTTTAMIGDSNFITAAEVADDNIAAMHEAAERAEDEAQRAEDEAQQAADEMEAEADADEMTEPAETETPETPKTVGGKWKIAETPKTVADETEIAENETDDEIPE